MGVYTYSLKKILTATLAQQPIKPTKREKTVIEREYNKIKTRMKRLKQQYDTEEKRNKLLSSSLQDRFYFIAIDYDIRMDIKVCLCSKF